MISIKLQTSKNVTVSAYRELYNTGYYVNREQMLTALCEELLDQVTKLEEQKAFSSSGNKVTEPAQTTGGAFVLHMPVQYMQENAKPKDVTIFNVLKDSLSKISKGESQGIILPALTDENGNKLFTLQYVGPDSTMIVNNMISPT